MEVPASTNIPLAAAKGGAGDGGGTLPSKMDDFSIYFKGHRVNLVLSPEPSAPPDKPAGDLVADVNRVKDTVSAVAQVVKTVLEDQDAKVSKVNCYKVLSRYAQNQVKLRGLEAKVRVLEERLAQQEKQQQRPFSPSVETESPSSSSSTSHRFLKQAQQDELARKAEKLQKFKAMHPTPSAVDGNCILTQDCVNDIGVGLEEDLSESSRQFTESAGERNNDEDDERSHSSIGSQSFPGDASMAYSTRSEARSTYALQLRDSEIQRAVGNIVIKKHSLDTAGKSYNPGNMYQRSCDDSKVWDDDDDIAMNPTMEEDPGRQESYEKNGEYSGYSEVDRAPTGDASNSKSYHDNFGRDNKYHEDDRNANVREDSNSSYESDYDSLPPPAAPRVEATDDDSDEGDKNDHAPSFQAREEEEKGAISESIPQETRPVETQAPKEGRRQRQGSIGMITAPFSAVASAGASVANAGASAVMKQAINARNYVMPASMGEGGPAGPSLAVPDGARAGWDGNSSGSAGESLDSPATEDVSQAQIDDPPQEKKQNRKKKALRVLALPIAVVAAPVAVAASPVALIVWQARKKKKAKRVKKAAAGANRDNAESGKAQTVAKIPERTKEKAAPLRTFQEAPPEARPKPEEGIPAVQLSDVEGVRAFDPAETLFVASLSDAREEPVVGDVEEKKENEKPEPKLGEFETGELRALTMMGIVPTPKPTPALPVKVKATSA